jgi:hypothetical protein
MRGKYTPADTVARVDDRDAQAGFCKNAACGEARHSRTEDRDIEVQSRLLLNVNDTEVTYDPKASVRLVPALFPEEESENRSPPQPGYLSLP